MKSIVLGPPLGRDAEAPATLARGPISTPSGGRVGRQSHSCARRAVHERLDTRALKQPVCAPQWAHDCQGNTCGQSYSLWKGAAKQGKQPGRQPLIYAHLSSGPIIVAIIVPRCWSRRAREMRKWGRSLACWAWCQLAARSGPCCCSFAAPRADDD